MASAERQNPGADRLLDQPCVTAPANERVSVLSVGPLNPTKNGCGSC